jgi:hypothetical protein
MQRIINIRLSYRPAALAGVKVAGRLARASPTIFCSGPAAADGSLIRPRVDELLCPLFSLLSDQKEVTASLAAETGRSSCVMNVRGS